MEKKFVKLTKVMYFRIPKGMSMKVAVEAADEMDSEGALESELITEIVKVDHHGEMLIKTI